MPGLGPGAMGPGMMPLLRASVEISKLKGPMDTAARVANVALDWIPIIGDVKAGIEAVVGYNLLGEKLSPAERIISALTILPLGDFLRLGKYTDEVADLLKHADEGEDVARVANKAEDVVRHGDEVVEGGEDVIRHADEAGDAARAVPSAKASRHMGEAGTLIGADTTVFRRDVEKLIAADKDHPLRFLLSESDRFKGSRLPHSELIDNPDLVQMGHVASKKAGGPEYVVIQDAWSNQIDNITIEHPSKGGIKVSTPVVDIGGVGVDLRTAKMWETEGFLKGVDLDKAPRVEF
jgi:hypothetical protein